MTDWICKEVQTENGGYFEPVIEMIQCKDCKIKPRCLMYRYNKDPYGFCKWAERKEE